MAPIIPPSFGQALLAMLQADVASTGGQPLVTLITSLAAAKGNRLLQQGAVLQFVAAAPSAGITIEIEVEQQLLQMALTAVQAYIAAKTPAVPAKP